eukprot:Platyproteum_vivax@DN6316_c0_g1_i1.p1
MVQVGDALAGLDEFQNKALYEECTRRSVHSCACLVKVLETFKTEPWVNLGKNKEVECYRLDNTNILDNGEVVNLYLGRIVLDHGYSWTTQEVADFLYHPQTRQEYDNLLKGAHRLALFPDFGAVVYQEFHKQFGVSGRSFLFSTYKTSTSKGEIIFGCSGLHDCEEAANLSNKHASDETVEGLMHIAGYVCRDGPIPGTVEVFFINSIDLCGSIPHFVTKAVFASQLTSLAALKDLLIQKVKERAPLSPQSPLRPWVTPADNSFVPLPVTTDEPFQTLNDNHQGLILGQTPGSWSDGTVDDVCGRLLVSEESARKGLKVKELLETGHTLKEALAVIRGIAD